MQEKSIIYKENLVLNINEEINYQKRFGILNNKTLFKKIFPIIILLIAITIVFAFAFKDTVYSFEMLFISAIIGCVLFCLFYRKNVKKSIVSIQKISYEQGFCQDKNKRLTFKKDGIEKIDPYSKAYLPYKYIERAISNRMAFVIKISGSDKALIVPKNGQNPDLLFEIDNILKEALNEKFVYEM